jgi:hypothetical protein
MKLLHAVFLGFGLLILVYLGLANSSGVVSIFNATGTQTVAATKTLQGR